jgi:hypothetical protein
LPNRKREPGKSPQYRLQNPRTLALGRLSPHLDSLKVTWPADEGPDTSYLGEYTSKEPSRHDLHAGNAIKRHKAGRHEYKFWVPCTTADEHRKGLNQKGYSRGQADYLARKYVREDYRRHEALCRGDWGFLGCVAKVR